MSRKLPIDREERSLPGHFQRLSGSCSVRMRWLLIACLALLAGCSSVGTKVDKVWLDDARGNVGLGKTLVLALTPDPEVVVTYENEWVRQLRERGIDASSRSLLLPGEATPAEERLIELLVVEDFDTLLLSRVADVKQVERDVSAYQVVVVETKLYDTKTEQAFWSASADTYLVNPTGERISSLRQERAREFVEMLMQRMAASNLF